MEYSLLKELITHVESYQEDHTSTRIEDFAIWLSNQLFELETKQSQTSHDELVIAFKLMHLNKTLKKRTKNVLSESAVSSIDEYSFLLHLKHQDSFRKMELVDLHNLEAPTGIEIIKRLLKNGFIEEFPDEDDKRAKRIKITPAGMLEVEQLQPKIDQIFSEFTTPLNPQQKVRMNGILDLLM